MEKHGCKVDLCKNGIFTYYLRHGKEIPATLTDYMTEAGPTYYIPCDLSMIAVTIPELEKIHLKEEEEKIEKEKMVVKTREEVFNKMLNSF